MSSPDTGRRSLALQSAQIFRYVLAGLFALVLFGGGPFVPSKAHAIGGTSSAPGYLTTTLHGNDRLYLVDKNEKMICVYGLNGSSLRLYSARHFNNDEELFDTSINVNGKNLEQFNGANYEQTEAYLKASKPAADATIAKATK